MLSTIPTVHSQRLKGAASDCYQERTCQQAIPTIRPTCGQVSTSSNDADLSRPRRKQERHDLGRGVRVAGCRQNLERDVEQRALPNVVLDLPPELKAPRLPNPWKRHEPR